MCEHSSSCQRFTPVYQETHHWEKLEVIAMTRQSTMLRKFLQYSQAQTNLYLFKTRALPHYATFFTNIVELETILHEKR